MMSVIEGVGDEVTLALTIFGVIMILVLSWLSTNVGNNPPAELSDHSHVYASPILPQNHMSPASHDALQEFVDDLELVEEFEADAASVAALHTDETATQSDASDHVDQSQNVTPVTTTSQITSANAEEIASTCPQSPSTPSTPLDNVKESDEGLRHRGHTKSDEVTESHDTNSSNVNQIKLRIKLLDETEKHVSCTPNETIGNIKRQYFHKELSEGKRVRFIFNGQVLSDDDWSVKKYSLSDGTILHCLVSAPRAPPAALHNTGNNGAQHHNIADMDDDGVILDISRLMLPLFGAILTLVWYCRIEYHAYFNAMSSLSLVGLTMAYVFGLFLMIRGTANHVVRD